MVDLTDDSVEYGYEPGQVPYNLEEIPAFLELELKRIRDNMLRVSGEWYDMIFPIVSAGRRGSSTDFSWTDYNSTGIYQPDFALNDDGIVVFHTNHDIMLGSKMYPHVHWSTSGTDTNPVHWELNYIQAKRDDDNPVAFGSKQTMTIIGTPSGTPYAHHVTETDDANAIDAPDVDSVIIMQIKRVTNGATDNADTVFGHFIDIHYQRGQLGSLNKAPDFFSNE